ncbi:hypothetical protein A3A05_00015 [Candidatus Nomurabacteria bacterium RIFCSPLOWO2_01_FULL_41_12]|uniref:DUF4365 domain-containing protein n=1 Tax=Candidatus Nomurabacteria bacterium RIFCSPLOWO2_01_FULL_41_12 TaxID=1801774 RepID=A0A1F6WX86_9BACT|nr:MAG: hypothetical protein A3A05_00015 [Candidatus Nomurabacteria bacterium RIFCSPLOWO2_01_FULL_41_12]
MTKQRRLHNQGGKRGNGWKRGMENLIIALGDSGEDAVQPMLGVVKLEHNSSEGDLWHKRLNAAIQVKTGGNTDHVSIRESQLDTHLVQCQGFPYSHCWYVFVKYRNRKRREDGRNLRLFQETVQEESEVPDFLGRHLKGVYVVDIKIVDALRHKLGATGWVRHGNGLFPSLEIGWRFFEKLRHSSEDVFRAVGLDPRCFRVRSHQAETKFSGHTLKFPFLYALDSRLEKRRRISFPVLKATEASKTA